MKKTFDFDFGNGEFVMKDGNPIILSGINALKLWIQKCIRTQLYRYSIYKDKQYGANIEDLVMGKSYNFDFAESFPIAVCAKKYPVNGRIEQCIINKLP